jgi:predicted exporter
MTVSKLKAFQELGFLAGAGFLMMLLATFTLIPALLSFGEGKINFKGVRKYPHALIQIPLEKPKWVVAGCLMLFTLFALPLWNYHLGSPLQEIYRSSHSKNNRSLKESERLSQLLNMSLVPIPLAVTGDNLEQALQLNDRLGVLLQSYQDRGSIAFFDTLSRWLPSEARQSVSKEALKNYPNLEEAQFLKIFSEIYTDESTVRKNSVKNSFPESVAKTLASREYTSLEAMRAAGLENLLENYFKNGPASYSVTTFVYLPYSHDFAAAKESLLKELTGEDMFRQGEVHYPSEEKILKEFKEIMKKDFLWIGGLALAAILILLWLSFRSVPMTLIGFIPVVLGGIGALGSYAMFFGSLSFVNLLWLPLYVGLCLDDNIHIGNSLRHGSPSLQEILRNTGGAICFTSLTNMVGMGSMALAPIPLLKQAGIFVVLALAWELLASLFFLPALLRLLKGVKP